MNTGNFNKNQIKAVSFCRGCGREIVWIKTKKGKNMPCGPCLHLIYRTGGEIFFTETGDVIHGSRENDGQNPIGKGRVSHWATCMAREQFRRFK